MKTFEDICRMTQPEVKEYMGDYLAEQGYEAISEDGFLYAKGIVPVLLVAHMDTVHKEQCKKIRNQKGRISSPQGIGGDDRCGIFIIMNLVQELKCSVLLCEDEEIGGVGARKFAKTDYIKALDVNYMVEFDRRGNNDAVFYSGANEEFISFVEDTTNFKFAHGSYSDISTLMPIAKLSAVNLSSGYYNAHTTDEYVIYDDMMDTIEAAKIMIQEECDGPFEYVAKRYASNPSYVPMSHSFSKNHNSRMDFAENDYYVNLFDEPEWNGDGNLAEIAKSDTDLELEVIVYDHSLSEETILATGDTKAECWMNLFLENPNLCFNDIVDYSWS